MKKSLFGFMALLLLVGISSRYVAGTYAKYTATLDTKTGTATVATWAFKAENDEVAKKTFTVNITSTVDNTSLIAGKIAPGTSGGFNIVLENEDSDVGVEFTMSLSAAENVPTNLVFKLNNVEFNPTTKVLKGYIARGETLTVPLTWVWAYETTDGDADDTTDGINAKTMTVSVDITAIQTNPSAAVTTSTAATMTIENAS